MSPRPGTAVALLVLLAAACGGGGGGRGAPAEAGTPEERAAARPAAGVGAEAGGGGAPDPTEEERAAARALFDAVNGERAGRGLRALGWSDGLAAVSRGYCAEMARTGIIAHESRISGAPPDRARRAGIPFVRLTENLALAADAATAHDGLMRSPGHRENILDAAVTELGVGAIFAVVDGARSLIVTQMFAAPPERVDPGVAAGELGRLLNEARRAGGLRPLARHAWLDGEAAAASPSCGSGAIASGAPKRKGPFHVYTAVMVEGGTIAQIAEGLAGNAHARSRESTHFGVAVARVEGPDGGGVCAVVLFAAKD